MPFNPRRGVVGSGVGWDHRCDVGDIDFSLASAGVGGGVISCLVCGRVWRLVVVFDDDRVGRDGRRRVRWAGWRPDVCPGCGRGPGECRHSGGRG